MKRYIKYVNKYDVMAEIEKLISNGKLKCQQSQENNDQLSHIAWSEHIATCGKILSFLDTLETEEIQKKKLYVVTRCEEHSDYVEKAFFSEKKAEEYCKQFEGNEDAYSRNITEIEVDYPVDVKDIDLKKEVINWWNDHYKNLKNDYKFENYNGHYMDNSTIINLAEHFYELGLKAQKINLKETGGSEIKWKSDQFDDICEILLNMIHSKGDVNKEAIQKNLDWIISMGETLCENEKYEEENKANHETF